MNEYRFKAPHAGRQAHWECLLLAPNLLTACLWLKKRANCSTMPVCVEKNRGKFSVGPNNKAYYITAKLEAIRKNPDKAAKAGKVFEEKLAEEVAAADESARRQLDQVELLWEDPYVITI